MYIRCLAALVASVLFLNIGITEAPKKSDDAKNIQGTWTIESVEGAEKPPADVLKKLRISITADKLTVKLDGEELNASSYKLSPSKKPKEIDLVVVVFIDKKVAVVRDMQPRLGIYDLQDDELKLCVAWATSKKTPEPANRPTEFKTGGDLVLMNLKREKK